MKIKLVANLLLSLSLIALLLTGNSCKNMFENPLKDKTTGDDVTLLLLDLNFFETKFKIYICDFQTMDYITDSDIKFAFIGRDSAAVVDYSGKRNVEYTTSSGYYELTCDPNIEISEANPLEFKIVAGSDAYFSFPTSVYITSKGTHDIYVYMLKIPDGLKSTFINYDDTFPVGLSYNPDDGINPMFTREALESSHGLDLSVYWLDGNYDFRSFWMNGKPGTATAQLFADSNTVDSWGFNYTKLGDPLDCNNYGPLHEHYFNEINYVILTGACPNGRVKCTSGIKVKYKSTNSLGGSASFPYMLTLYNERKIRGSHSGDLPEFTGEINGYYYARGITNATLQISGNSQYDVNPKTITINNICASTPLEFTITVTPKANLTHYVFTYVLSCSSGIVGGALTYNIQLRKHGSDEAWTPASLAGGRCDLYLERNQIYDFRFNYNGKWTEFSVSTDPNNLEAFLAAVNSDKYRFVSGGVENPRGLKITDNGSVVIVNACIQLLSSDVCNVLSRN
jgi:hypothetical protein